AVKTYLLPETVPPIQRHAGGVGQNFPPAERLPNLHPGRNEMMRDHGDMPPRVDRAAVDIAGINISRECIQPTALVCPLRDPIVVVDHREIADRGSDFGRTQWN